MRKGTLKTKTWMTTQSGKGSAEGGEGDRRSGGEKERISYSCGQAG